MHNIVYACYATSFQVIVTPFQRNTGQATKGFTKLYQEKVGSIFFVAPMTRLDLARAAAALFKLCEPRSARTLFFAAIYSPSQTQTDNKWTSLNLLLLNMMSCSCGRQFNSDEALAQHQADRRRFWNSATTCQASNADSAIRAARSSPSHASREAWMWKDVGSREAIQTIDCATLQSSPTSVSSMPAYELLCSYNWQNCKEATLRVPGKRPRLCLAWAC